MDAEPGSTAETALFVRVADVDPVDSLGESALGHSDLMRPETVFGKQYVALEHHRIVDGDPGRDMSSFLPDRFIQGL